jgi:hypothetical protein
MTIKCRPITTDQDQFQLDNLMNYCMQNGLSMMTMRTASDAINISVEDNGSEAYHRIEAHVKSIFEAIDGKD